MGRRRVLRLVRRGDRQRESLAVVDARAVVVTVFPLRPDARQRIAERLGSVRVLDMRDCHEEPSLVLAPVCSPQVLEKLRAIYPTATLIVVELEDLAFGIDYSGPVKRVLDAGADRYLTANSVDDLARQLRGSDPRSELALAAPLALKAGTADDLILANIARLARLDVTGGTVTLRGQTVLGTLDATNAVLQFGP